LKFTKKIWNIKENNHLFKTLMNTPVVAESQWSETHEFWSKLGEALLSCSYNKIP
jgi:hypothetical protein